MTTELFAGGEELKDFLLQRITRKGCSVELTDKWITENEDLKALALELFSPECKNHSVLEPRQGERPKNTVRICSVIGTEYEYIFDDEDVAVYAGGPGSMVGAALNSALAHQDGSGKKVLFAAYSFEHSNARSSGYEFHLRDSNALDENVYKRGHRILLSFLRRKMVSQKKLLSEVQGLTHVNVDISTTGLFSSPTICLKTLGIFLLGICHTMRNVTLTSLGLSQYTDWVRNRSFSQDSVPVLRFLESYASSLGVCSSRGQAPSLLLGLKSEQERPENIYVVFDEDSSRVLEESNEIWHKYSGIESQELDKAELAEMMGGEADAIHKAFLYPGDGRLSPDINVVLRNIVQATGNTWKEGVLVEKVFVDHEKVRGVLLYDAISEKRWYQPCSSAVLSLGYTAQYEFERPVPAATHRSSGLFRSLISLLQWKFGARSPVGFTSVAAGASGYFLIRGRIPIIASNMHMGSHWTEVGYSPEANITLAKLTAGGNLASEKACVTHLLNNIECARKMFGDRLIGFLSADSCPRTINAQNDVQFYQAVPGLAIAVGLGGTGMTKCGANGAMSYLLSNPEIHASEVIPGLFDKVDLGTFITDCTTNTQRALGHRQDFSLLETCSIAGIGLGVSLALAWKKLSGRHSRKQSGSARTGGTAATYNIAAAALLCPQRVFPIPAAALLCPQRVFPGRTVSTFIPRRSITTTTSMYPFLLRSSGGTRVIRAFLYCLRRF